MSYLVFCTFDLEDADWEDYETAYADLEKIGLYKVVVSDQGNDVVVPTTSVIGQFDGQSAKDVRDHIRTRVRSAFKARHFKSEIFVVVGGDWAWAAVKT
jgi:hypothetical protein